MDKDQLKELVIKAIDNHQEEIINIGRKIWNNPELGYKEYDTAQTVKDVFSRYGIEYRSEVARTGVIAELTGKSQQAKVAILGELDAIIVYEHPDSNKETGAVHACGHCAMITALMGVAIGLVESGVMQHLDGAVKLIAVPAEEFIELEYRQRLQADGDIEFMGGKQELIKLGEFDDVDVAMMFHGSANPEAKVLVSGNTNGFIGKTVKYIGKQAHAGGAPFDGINALNAAMLGLMGIHANRETFKDEDSIRVHPIITKGGDMVNNVPAEVKMETYVRGSNIEAIISANEKVNNALKGGAMSVGAKVEITEIPGYLPLIQNPMMSDLFAENAVQIIGEENVSKAGRSGGSTDMGDVRQIIPSIHPSTGGIIGTLHTKDMKIIDEYAAYIVPAKCLAMTSIDLLYNNAINTKKVLENFDQAMTKEEYLNMWRELTSK